MFLIFFYNVFSNAKAIIYTNEEEKKNSYVFLNKNQLLEMNGIDRPNFNIHEKIKNDSVNLFFLARIDFSHKGVDILLKSLFYLKDFFEEQNCIFTFYGKGSSEQEKLFLQKLKELFLTKNT